MMNDFSRIGLIRGTVISMISVNPRMSLPFQSFGAEVARGSFEAC